MRTTLVVRDSEESTFEPFCGTLPEEHARYAVCNKQVKVVPVSNVKLAATKVLVVNPEQMQALSRIFYSKSPLRMFTKLASVDGFVSTLDVIKKGDMTEVFMRVCVDRQFMKGVENASEMLKHDLSKVRRIPGSCLHLIKTLIDEGKIKTSDLPSNGKKLKDALSHVEEDAQKADTPENRIDFTPFEPAEGVRCLLSASKLATSTVDRKRKRDQQMAERDELSSLVKHVRLPNVNQIAYCFEGAESIDVVGSTVIVKYAEGVAEAAEDEDEE